MIDFGYVPTIKQKLFHMAKVDEVLFGGAAGGGKSYAIIMDAIDICLRNAGIKAYIFRRSYKELEDNLIPIAREKVSKSIGEYIKSSHEILFVNGSILRFRNLRTDEDKLKYQGCEINALYIDELTHFTKDQYDFLKSRLRVNKSTGFKPIVRCSSNPGGRGHSFVKQYFVDVAPFGTIYKTNVESKIIGKTRVMTRVYIPALVTDNPHINDEYIFELESKPKALRDAFLYGKWDAFEGQVFYEWKDDESHYIDRKFSHVIEPFDIPKNYKIYRAFDFGYSRPFSVLWFAVSPDGVYYLFNEWYGAISPNVGMKIAPSEIAKGILQRDGERKVYTSFADPSIWDSSRGESVAMQMEREGVFFIPGDNARISGKMAIHNCLRFDENGYCRLYVFNTCRSFIRTFSALYYDSNNPEDIDTNCEDHSYDALRYFIMNNICGFKKNSGFNPLEEERKKSSFI